MGRRYSRITQSASLRPALDRYVQYLNGTLTRPSRVGTRGAREATQPVYIVPFGFDLAADQVIEARANPNAYNALQTYINAVPGGEVLNAAGAAAKTKVPYTGFQPARVIWFRNATRVATVRSSDVTGLEYLDYNGTRSSCPFGRGTADADQYDVFNEIKSDLRAVPNLAVNRVSISRERFSYQ